MPDVERTGDVWRRDDDRIGLCARLGPCPGGERIGLLPGGIDAGLGGAGFVGLVDHWAVQTGMAASAAGNWGSSKRGRALEVNGRVGARPAYSTPREIRAISFSTIRSTTDGRCSSSQALSMGRSMSRIMPSMVWPAGTWDWLLSRAKFCWTA